MTAFVVDDDPAGALAAYAFDEDCIGNPRRPTAADVTGRYDVWESCGGTINDIVTSPCARTAPTSRCSCSSRSSTPPTSPRSTPPSASLTPATTDVDRRQRGGRRVRAVPSASVNGIDVHYERGGEGPPLLFCNGSGATLESSAPVIARFREHFDVVAHDQRGLGRTTIPAGPYSMADYAADAAALLDHVGWERCAVVGISFGGMVAQELAVTWPERITRLALVCTSPGGAGRASYPLHELAELPPAEAAAIGLQLLDTRFTPAWLAAHPQDRALVEARAARNARRRRRRCGAASSSSSAPAATTTCGTACRG